MRHKGLIAAIMLVVLGGAGYTAWRLTHPGLSEREQVLRLFDQLEQGVETRTPRTILDTVANDYRDPFGYTKRDIYRLSLSLRRTQGAPAPEVVIDEISLELEQGTGTAKATVTGRVTMHETGFEAQRYAGSVTFHLRKERGRWLITSTEGWQEQVAAEYE